jgi:general secretion pathway protein I
MRGFTLVEVLVAVAVVALAVTALLTAMMRQIDGSTYLRDKLFAQWVALNQLELIRLENRHSNQLPVATSGSVEMAGRTWYWWAQPKQSQADGFVQLDLSVAAVEEEGAQPLATVTAILDIYHRKPAL